MPSVSVVICTYNRPGPLHGAVRTAREQTLPDGVTAEVIVVDNSPDANARDGVAAMGDGPGLPLRYVSVPEPNISRARNAGVAAGDGPYVVFLDDDEWCEPGWLTALVRTAEDTGADAVFGAVIPDFPDGRPDWDPTGRPHERLLDRPSGTPMGIRHEAGASGRWIGTGNSLLRRATCLDGPEPFDPRIGRTGGEDFDLFIRLHAAGRRFVWCREAVVHELVPGNRAGMDYLLGRSRRSGQIYAMVTVRRAARPWLAAANVAVRAAVQVPLVAAGYLAARAGGKPDAARRRLKLANAVGKLLWWPPPGQHQ